MPPDNARLLSEQLWMDALVMVLVDAAFMALLTWRVKSPTFRDLKCTLAGTAAVFWSIFGLVLVSVFWNTYYQYFFPGWLRSGGILLFVPILYGVFALAFHWLALRLPGNPILTFCLLGGLESLVEHLWGFYGLKILEVPLLQKASPASMLVFAFPEYIFYWCIVIGIAVVLQNGWRWGIGLRQKGGRVA